MSYFFNIERIAFHAEIEDRFKENKKAKAGVQQKLTMLARSSEFKGILQEEVDKRKLVPKDAWACVDKIYHEVSKHAHGNSEPIQLDKGMFTPNELVVLISFFRLQQNWQGALEWEVVSSNARRGGLERV
jgi:hypothetical protein